MAATRIANVTFDCADPARLADFWAEALGWTRQTSDAGNQAVVPPDGVGPRLLFIRVPEPKTVKNRVHLDLSVPDMEAEVTRLVGLGATVVQRVEEAGQSWTVMQDPEGNEFCL